MQNRLDQLDNCALLRAAKHDADAFEVFYRRHTRAVTYWLYGKTGDMEVALDLCAETFSQALTALHRFHGDHDGAALGWLFGIARNLLAHWRRKRKVETATCERLFVRDDVYQADESELVALQADAETYKPELVEVLKTLPENQREALGLRVFAEYSYAQIAEQTGVSELNARARVSRALRRLSDRLSDSEIGEGR